MKPKQKTMQKNNSTKCYWVIIPAAGVGSRFGTDTPKQYARINDLTVLEHSVHPFLQIPFINKIVIAIASNDPFAKQLATLNNERIEFTTGGETRAESVLNALNHIEPYCKQDDWVIVHDSVRPCLTNNELESFIALLPTAACGALLAVPVTDTLKNVQDHRVQSSLDRRNIWRAQTPQAFPFSILKNAISSAVDDISSITDESSAIERMGHNPLIVKGLESNIKITYPEDLDLARYHLTRPRTISTTRENN